MMGLLGPELPDDVAGKDIEYVLCDLAGSQAASLY